MKCTVHDLEAWIRTLDASNYKLWVHIVLLPELYLGQIIFSIILLYCCKGEIAICKNATAAVDKSEERQSCRDVWCHSYAQSFIAKLVLIAHFKRLPISSDTQNGPQPHIYTYISSKYLPSI